MISTAKPNKRRLLARQLKCRADPGPIQAAAETRVIGVARIAHKKRFRAIAMTAMAATLFLGACQAVDAGNAVGSHVDHTAGPTPALLDPGGYPTEAVPPPANSIAAAGVVAEGHRMADAVVIPSEVDSQLRQLRPSNTGAVEDALALRADMGRSRANIAANHGFVAGFSSARDTRTGSETRIAAVNLVVQFANRNAAAAAAAEMAATNSEQRRALIPRHPDAAAAVFDMAQGAVVESFTPHGSYVFYQWVQSTGRVGTATDFIAETLDRQGPRIDAFTPTPSSQLLTLSVDPTTGLLAHTLTVNPGSSNPASGVYSARAAMHFQHDSVDSVAVLASGPIISMSLRDAVVYETGDAAAATRVVEQMAIHQSTAGATAIEGVTGLPNAQCFDAGMESPRTQPRFRCYASASKYAFNTSSELQDNARKQAAAQFLMLYGY
jgi:hypothetical protein